MNHKTWKLAEGAQTFVVDGEETIAEALGDYEVALVRARLLAAAPELLDALELIESSTAVLNHLDAEHLDVINAALAKARGR